MGISTAAFFEINAKRISDLQTALFKSHSQISTGRRVVSPSDDPLASARTLEVEQLISTNSQYNTNRQSAKDSLNIIESNLSNMTEVLQNLKTTVVNAGNPTLDDTQRQFLVTDLQNRFSELLSLANARDGNGRYLYSGYQVGVQPFVIGGTNVQYVGDQGERSVQASASRQIPMSLAGNLIFENNLAGNGSFTTAATVANTGSGLISVGSALNPALLTRHNYAINFSGSGSATTYSVIDTTTGATLSAGNPYISGQAITFDGMQLEISGSPANGDQFIVQPSTKQSVFKTISDLISALQKPSNTAAQHTALANSLSSANINLDQVFSNVSTVRATVGAHLRDIDTMDAVGEDLNLSYQKNRSDLVDIDYAKSISEFSLQNILLEAAQKSFAQISQLSLFNYL